MQYFGVLETKYEEVFLTSSYLYLNKEDEEIDTKQFKQLIKTNKDKKKNIIGTIILYSPIVTPIDCDSNTFLLNQDFDKYDELVELKIENYLTIFKQAMKNKFEGKIVEVINLFNLVEKNIDASSLLMKFDSDLEIYYSQQNTEFDRDIMYLDCKNIIPKGKFVFFAWGEKINPKEFIYINNYAQTIFRRCKFELNKNVAFIYKKEKTLQWAEDFIQFASISQTSKYKNSINNSIKKSFENFPPTCEAYE
ncbi:hypothetical protein CP965_00150 [Halarcobacter mediterraneus]|uniref:Uncharacterized protein n=1 Tax=Halarcobacter mediterraneus TaxID=2023153 RepID=A0A4Q1AV47_9BACT|nr:hypothetical protein [Halarcobacter mediterraneus]RXK13895.1 hypothetical protein CP965_00150 [Halarcobacter mediterraneus]